MISFKNRWVKVIAAAFYFTILVFGFAAVAQIPQPEKKIISDAPLTVEEEPERKERIYMHSFYEASWVEQGNKNGYWQTWTNRIAYLNDGLQQPYIDFTQYKRFDEEDYAIEAGSYFKIEDGYIHGNMGYARFGESNFTYNWKWMLEVEHKLFDNVYINVDGTYFNKTPNDVYVLTPGLVYYFGNHFIEANYGATFITDRGVGNFFTLRGNFFITKHVSIFGGMAFGEWLYDIFERESYKETGYIFFSGINIHITENIMIRGMGTWAHEDPKFDKSGFNAGLAVKF